MRDVPRNGFDKRWRLRYGGPLPMPVWTWDNRKTSGHTLYDASGYGNHGTITGATWETSERGNVLLFDGSGDYVDVSSTGFVITDGIPFTLAAWVELSTYATSSYPGIFTCPISGSAQNFELAASESVGYYPLLFGALDDSVPRLRQDISVAFPLGERIHIALVYNGGTLSNSTSYTLYRNGLSVATTAAGVFASDTSGVTKIGQEGPHIWNGYIEQFAILGHVTSGQIRSLYQSQLNGGPGLLGRSFARHVPVATASEVAFPYWGVESRSKIALAGSHSHIGR